MRIFPGATAYAAARTAGAPPLAVAIGNFDGVHLGHRALLDETRARALRRGGASAVLTFTPHPARLFAPAKAPPLIMSLARRLELCAEAGIDVAIVDTVNTIYLTHRPYRVRLRATEPINPSVAVAACAQRIHSLR